MKKKTVLLVFAAIMLLASAACAETDIEIENYTRYTDYEPQLTEPLGLIQGENHKVLVAWFSRVGNTVFEPDVDVVSSATLQHNSSGELLGNLIPIPLTMTRLWQWAKGRTSTLSI